MKKNTNAKKGFGFGDALFGMKQLQMDYDNIAQKEQKVQEVQEKIQKKPTVNKTNPMKPTIIKKQPIKPNAPKQNLSIQQPKNNSNVFKLNAGKQYESVGLVQLIPCQVQQNVTELTLKGKPSNWEFNVFCDGLPSSAFVENPIVGFNFGANDVFQGNLGNCYFISSLASLSHLPKVLLRQRIPEYKKYNGKEKTYKVNLFESGKSVNMTVDNLFPKVYSRPIENDIGPMILEKAYAQLYGNYEIINNGYSADSLRDLTGAPSEYLQLVDKMQVKNTVEKIIKEKYPAVLDSKGTVSNQYITPKHSYIVTDYKIKNNDVFLKIRDPRGRNMEDMPMPIETGNDITFEQKSNGVFWANFNALKNNFQVLAYSKVKYGYQYFYKTFQERELTNHHASLILKVMEPTIVHFSVHQKHKKFFNKYSYKILRLLIGSVEIKDGKIKAKQLVQSNFNTRPACTISCELLPGEYVMMGGIGNGQKVKCPDEAITFSVYSNNPNIEFLFAKNYTNAQPFIQNYMDKNRHLFKDSISDKNLCRYFGPLYGHICLFYSNESKKQVLEQMAYTVQNIEIKEKKVSLRMAEKKLIMHPIGDQNNCSHRFAFKTTTNYKG